MKKKMIRKNNLKNGATGQPIPKEKFKKSKWEQLDLDLFPNEREQEMLKMHKWMLR